MRPIRYRFGEFLLDPAVRELSRSGERLPLPLKSLECVVYLVCHRARAVGRDELASAVWGRVDVSDAVISQTLRRARKALDDAGDRQAMIRTVSGFGYHWVAPVEELEEAAAPATVPAPALLPSAGDMEEELPLPAAMPMAARPSPPRRRRWPLWMGAACCLLVVLVGAGWYAGLYGSVSSDGSAAVDARVVVMPVSVEPPGAEVSWVRLGAMEYVADRLRGAGLEVTPSDQTLHLDATLKRDSAEPRSAPEAQALRALGARASAHWVIAPRAQRTGSHWRVVLRAVDGTRDVSVEASGDTPLQAMAVATDAWLQRIHRAAAVQAGPTALQERLRRIDAELDAGQLEAARRQLRDTPAQVRQLPALQVREGQLEYRAGRMREATQLFEGALRATPAADAQTRAKGIMGLGGVALREDRAGDAQRHYSEALALLGTQPGSVPMLGLQGNAYNGRGVARAQQNDLAGAVGDLGQARSAMRRTGDVVSAAMVGANLGRMEGMRNHWPQALQEFDTAIGVFEQFQVSDYLAATLAAKAQAQLEMLQPAAALATLAQADRLQARLEDRTLLAVLDAARVRVALANGRLAQAGAALNAASSEEDSGDPSRLAWQMALDLARGDVRAAAERAPRLVDGDVPLAAEWGLIAAQASAQQHVARRWLAGAAVDTPTGALADAVLLERFGARADALSASARARELADREGSPNDRLRAGVAHAWALMARDRFEDAAAVLGELDAYAATDYRVAWSIWTLYERRGEADLARTARRQVQRLAGERPLSAKPLL